MFQFSNLRFTTSCITERCLTGFFFLGTRHLIIAITTYGKWSVFKAFVTSYWLTGPSPARFLDHLHRTRPRSSPTRSIVPTKSLEQARRD